MVLKKYGKIIYFNRLLVFACFYALFIMSKVPGKKTAFQGRAKQILIRIADNRGPLTTSALVDMLGMTRPNTCTYLTRLQEEGFIETEPGTHDKRLRYHSLTAKGREYMDSWQSEQVDRYENSRNSKSYKKNKPRPAVEEALDDLLEDCEKIVYDNDFSVNPDEARK